MCLIFPILPTFSIFFICPHVLRLPIFPSLLFIFPSHLFIFPSYMPHLSLLSNLFSLPFILAFPPSFPIIPISPNLFQSLISLLILTLLLLLLCSYSFSLTLSLSLILTLTLILTFTLFLFFRSEYESKINPT